MQKPALNIQDSFLNQSRKDKIKVTIHLVDGSEIHGKISAFDNFTVMIHDETRDSQHLVYKHSIACISPVENIKLGNPNT